MTQPPAPGGRVLGRSRVRLQLEALGRPALDGMPDAPDGPRVRSDLAIIPWFEDERPFQGLLGLFDWRADGALSALARDGVASGGWGESILLPGASGLPVARVVLLGCGRLADFDADAASSLGGKAASVALGLRPQSVLVGLPNNGAERDVLESLFLGLLRGIEDASAEEPEAVLTTQTHPWWVVVDDRHIPRLRRLLDGPLRPAVETTSSS
ncbi:MAG: M17 family peptidase N-terminal domain-containing protein [Nannocystaceae bacterium]|nr:hypothetical protein [bacterium]